ncbi:MAG: 30S ribosomal protein S17 [Candidatus Enteromonas sp.]
MERNNRISVQGTVTSVKMNKTIVVTVSTERNHPLYGKRVGYRKKFYAHDENNSAELGDVVTIMATRPISKMVRFRLVSIDKKAIVPEAVNDAATEAEEVK